MSILRYEDFSIDKVHKIMFGRGFLRPLAKGNYITKMIKKAIPTSDSQAGWLVRR